MNLKRFIGFLKLINWIITCDVSTAVAIAAWFSNEIRAQKQKQKYDYNVTNEYKIIQKHTNVVFNCVNVKLCR